MKERSFPASFWRPPNRPNQNINSTQSCKGQLLETRTGRIKITSPPDTNLLFSLFKILEQEHQLNRSKRSNIGLKVTEPIATSQLNDDDSTNVGDFSSDEKEDADMGGVLDDPYMSTKQELSQLGATLEISKNYSDILSDLVVNL